MGEFENCFSSLLCYETEEEACCFGTKAAEDDHESLYLNDHDDRKDDDDEYIENLVQRETCTTSDYPVTSRNKWLQCARLNAVEWIFNIRTLFGFQMYTAYMSVIYFDRFLSKKSIDDGKLWTIRLLSVACLSLAAKMEECRVPFLSEYPIQDYQFENETIQRMELLVLSTLEWKMSCVTPFAYLSYFIYKFYGESRPEGLVSKALQHIVLIIKEINLVDYRSSIIAAAAVLAALPDERLTRKAMEIKMDFISFWGSIETENVYGCYNMMQEIEMRKGKTPEIVISWNNCGSAAAAAAAAAAGNYGEEVSRRRSGVGIKRKLAFMESGDE